MPSHETKAPWDPEPIDAVDEFDKRIAGENFAFPAAPWDKNQEVLVTQSPSKTKNYKFDSLHEPTPMTEAKKKQLASYKYNPPFTTETNASIAANKNEKNGHHTTPRPPTIAPWTYGDMDEDAHGGKKTLKAPQNTSLWHTPESEKPKQPAFESSGDPILDKLRQTLRDRGAMGIFGLSKKFKIMDDDNSGYLNEAEFNKAMNECRMELTKQQLKHLFRYFDKSDDGNISYDEFLTGIRGVLNRRRKAMVHLAFNILDKDSSGIIDMDDIIDVYDVSRHPDVIARKRTKNDILKEFISSMEVGADKDGQVRL